jgi:hypothetical protein
MKGNDVRTYLAACAILMCVACSEDSSSPPGEQLPEINPCDLKDAKKISLTIVEMSLLTQHELLAGYYAGPNAPKDIGRVFNEDVRNSALWLDRPYHFYLQEVCEIETCWDVVWADGNGKSWQNNDSMPYLINLYETNVIFRNACISRGMDGADLNNSMQDLEWDDGLMSIFIQQLEEDNVQIGVNKKYYDIIPLLIVNNVPGMNPAQELSTLGMCSNESRFIIINSTAISNLVENGNGNTAFSVFLERMTEVVWLPYEGSVENQKHYLEYWVRMHEIGHWWMELPGDENEHHQYHCEEGDWHENEFIGHSCAMLDLGWLSSHDDNRISLSGYCSCCWQSMAYTNMLYP